MPWSETCAMDERMRFVIAASDDEAVMSAICAEFGIVGRPATNGLSVIGVKARRD